MNPAKALFPVALSLVSVLLLASCGKEAPPPVPSAAAPAAEPAPQPAPQPAIPLEKAQRWMTYQYLINTPEQAPAMVGGLLDAGWHTVNPDANALGVLTVFLGRLGAASPGVLDAWTEAASAEGVAPEKAFVFGYAVWDADPANAAPRLRRIAGMLDGQEAADLVELIDQTPPDLRQLTPDSALVLDYWWAGFLATGDTAWVDLVLAVIPAAGVSFEDSGLDDPVRMEVTRAGAWSLSSNAAQHPRVLDHLRSRLNEAGIEWPTIARIVESAGRAAAENPPELP
jgi:hypothetical protein